MIKVKDYVLFLISVRDFTGKALAMKIQYVESWTHDDNNQGRVSYPYHIDRVNWTAGQMSNYTHYLVNFFFSNFELALAIEPIQVRERERADYGVDILKYSDRNHIWFKQILLPSK